MQRSAAILLIFLFSAGILFPAAAQARALRLVTSYWPPYHMEEFGKPTGLATDVVESVLHELEVDCEIRMVPWKRCMLMVENGEADGVYLISFSEGREKFLQFCKVPICRSTYVFFIRTQDRPSLHFNSYEDLAGHRVGVTAGYSYCPEFWEGMEEHNVKVEAVRSDEQNMKKLLRERIDFFPCDHAVGVYLMRQMGVYYGLTFLDKPVTIKDYTLALSKKSDYPDLPQLAERFDRELENLKASPKYDRLKEKYLKLDLFQRR